jgi:uncharacterized radical SAM protein YgiQ
MTRAEMDRLDWGELDVLLVTGDAYVDHPSFGAPLLGRWLVSHGYKTGIIAQPRWEVVDDFTAMGRPRLFAGVTAGSLDSMLAHYTAFRKKRSDDAYTPGGQAGARPNRAVIAYANLARRAFPGLPVVLGGIEASLRRCSHYDFWSNSLRRSILLDSKATAVLYGMAEHSVLALAEGLDLLEEEGGELRDVLARIPGAVFAVKSGDLPETFAAGAPIDAYAGNGPGRAGKPDISPEGLLLELPSHEAIQADPSLLIQATLLLERHVHQNRQFAVQPCGDRIVVLAPPGLGLEGTGLDELYALPFSRQAHPSYTEPIPATRMIEGSLTTHRGCAGGCSFCTLALHQGRRIRSRGRDSVLDEAARMVRIRGFSGSVSDVGGPSANMWGARCLGDMAACNRASCLTPKICKHFKVRQKDFVELLKRVEGLPGVRHVRVASGWRMDLGLTDMPALSRMIGEFTGGQAKVAPEHKTGRVLRLMRKPSFAVFEEFLRVFDRQSGLAGKEQYVVPYLMSAFPGCAEEDMRDLAGWLKSKGWKPSQVQCFIPLPGTAASAMYFAGTDLEGNPIHVAVTDAERLRQHALLAPEREGRGRPGVVSPADRSGRAGASGNARPGGSRKGNGPKSGRRGGGLRRPKG